MTGHIKLSDHITLKNVLFVPAFTINLISVTQTADDKVFHFLFTSDECILQEISLKTSIGLAKRHKSLFVLPIKDVSHFIAFNKTSQIHNHGLMENHMNN